MSARLRPRSVSLPAPIPQQLRRRLHITLPAPTTKSWLGADLRNQRYGPQSLPALQRECQRRRLSTSGNKTEVRTIPVEPCIISMKLRLT